MIPNLDCMVAADLRRFARLHRDGRNPVAAAALLETGKVKPLHWRLTVASLARYADTKAEAMERRATGDIAAALRLEEACDAIYSRLPDYARW